MASLRKIMESNEKHLSKDLEGESDGNDDVNSDAEEDTEISHTVGSFKEKCADLEKKMKDTMNELKRSTDGKSLQQCSTVLKQNAREWLSMEDQLGRTCLHVTVEENNIRLTECLLVSGAEVNRPEGYFI